MIGTPHGRTRVEINAPFGGWPLPGPAKPIDEPNPARQAAHPRTPLRATSERPPHRRFPCPTLPTDRQTLNPGVGIHEPSGARGLASETWDRRTKSSPPGGPPKTPLRATSEHPPHRRWRGQETRKGPANGRAFPRFKTQSALTASRKTRTRSTKYTRRLEPRARGPSRA